MLRRSLRTWRYGPWTPVRGMARPGPKGPQFPLDLTATSKYPLSEQLRDEYAGLTSREKRSVPQRTQIVSPSLCDDALSLLGPSLESCKGCDIIDLNPGVGLWSQKIHDALKPRSHMLVEPNTALYGRYLKPLVEAPNSTYNMVEGDPTRTDTLEPLMSGGYLPHQKASVPGDPPSQELNNSLLITGALMWDPTLPGLSFTSMAKQLVYRYLNMAWRNELFHKFGPVRMLLWLSPSDQKDLVPKSLQHLAKYGYNAQLKCDVTEIVGAPLETKGRGPGVLSRDPRYEFESLIRAMKTAKQSGAWLPEHRRDIRHEFAEDIERLTNGTAIMTAEECNTYLAEQEMKGKSTLGILRDAYRVYLREEAEYRRNLSPPTALATPEIPEDVPKKMGKPPKAKPVDESDVPKKRGRPRKVQPVEESEGKERLTKTGTEDRRYAKHGVQLARDRAKFRQGINIQIKRDELVDIGEKIYRLECRYLNTPANESDELKEIRAEISELGSQFDKGEQATLAHIRTQISSDLDDRLSLHGKSRLQWDERPFEPLVMQREEVWPPNIAQLTLITPKPRPTDLSAPDDLEAFQDFTDALLRYIHLPLASALDHMLHGLSDITKSVKELTDLEKGGRLDMNRMTVRMVTHEQLLALYSAYRDWPFRPPGTERKNYFQTTMDRNT